MTNDEYISGAPIYTKRVIHSVTIGEDNEIERKYEVLADHYLKEKVYVYAPKGFFDMPIEDVPLLINALTDFIK